jgi:hypothetical protein
MPDPLRSHWIRLAVLVVALAPISVGLLLEASWLVQIGAWWLFAFLLGLIGLESQRLHKRREVRENMRRILEEREGQGRRIRHASIFLRGKTEGVSPPAWN